MMSLPAESAMSARGAKICASRKMELYASSVRLLFDNHEIGADTVMLPASDPGLPAPPVEMITLDMASWLSSVVLLMTEVAVGVQTPPENDPPDSIPVEMTMS